MKSFFSIFLPGQPHIKKAKDENKVAVYSHLLLFHMLLVGKQSDLGYSIGQVF